MEFDILYWVVVFEIVEFYGVFIIEFCVYYCMEYMDVGLFDFFIGGGVVVKDQIKEEEDDVIE